MLTTIIHALVACNLVTTPPPATREAPVEETIHGERFVDEYRWLEELEADSPEVEAWTTSQNNHTREVLDALPCRSSLEKQFRELLTVDSISAPSMRGSRYFYRQRKGTQNQSVLLVRDGIRGTARVLIDPNTLDKDGLISLDWYQPSQDGTLVAFGLSRAGDEMTTLHVLRTSNGEWLPDEIPGKARISGWSPDGRGFLYSRLSDPADPYSRVIRWHVLGRSERHDETLFEQQEPSKVPFASLSRNGRWILHGVTEGWSRTKRT